MIWTDLKLLDFIGVHRLEGISTITYWHIGFSCDAGLDYSHKIKRTLIPIKAHSAQKIAVLY